MIESDVKPADGEEEEGEKEERYAPFILDSDLPTPIESFVIAGPVG